MTTNDGTSLPVVFVARMHWRPDNTANNCGLCSSEFRFYRRRHHCRQCGGLFCWRCSSKRLPTFVPGCEAVADNVRVCHLCALKRTGPEFTWETELAQYFGTDVARRGARLLREHDSFMERLGLHGSRPPGTWSTAAGTIGGEEVTTHSFLPADRDIDIDPPGPTPDKRAFWIREETPSHYHLRGEDGKKKETLEELGECPICQLDLTDLAGVDFKLSTEGPKEHSMGTNPNAITTINRCGHTFHAACVAKWLKDHPSCPMCRQNAFIES